MSWMTEFVRAGFRLDPLEKGESTMKTATIAGIVLLILGVVSLAYQGITYTTQKKVVDIGPIHATEDQKHNIPLPPVIGGILLVGGIVLLMTGSTKASG